MELLEQAISESRSEITKEELKTIENKNFWKLAKEFDLDLTREYDFIKWPLFFGIKEDNEINVCAICFGALTLLNRNKEQGYVYDDAIADYLNAAINSLILSHLNDASKITKKNGITYEEHVCWPRNYYIGTTQLESATINQTTLSLSTLFVLGFLDKTSSITNRTINDDALKERVKFIINALKWILYVQNRDGKIASWSYAQKCKESNSNNEIKSATLPTHYCVETMEKYYKLFTENAQIRSMVEAIDHSIIDRIRTSCDASILYFKLKQNDDGGFMRSSNDKSSTIFHTCLVEKALCFDRTKDYSNLKKAVSFLVKKLLFKDFNFKNDDFFEKYKYEVSRFLYTEKDGKYVQNEIKTFDNEEFEVFPETLFILTNINVLELDSCTNNKLLSYWQKRVIYESIYKAYTILFKRFENKNGYVLVRGRREASELQFPIYNIYYAKLCLSKLNNSIISNNKIMSTPCTTVISSFLKRILIIVLMVVAMNLDTKSTILWIITAILGIAVPMAADYTTNFSQYKSIKK